jgi:ribosomal protein L44E
LPYDLPKLSVQSIDPPPSTAQPTSPFKKSPEIDTYCKACKKKFNNAITYTNHLKSAKHIANEKKLTNTSAKSSSSTRITVNPQVQGMKKMMLLIEY